MPAFYTHERFGEKVIQYLPPDFADFLKKHFSVFRIGLQGPDILFYHKPLSSNPVKARGVELHHKSGDAFFVEQFNKAVDASNEYKPFKIAYLCGLLCHYSLDVAFHPYIYKVEDTGVSHAKIESELDKYFLVKDGKPIRGYNTAQHIENTNVHSFVVAETFAISEEEAKRALKTIRKLNGWFSSKSEAFHSIAHLGLRLVGMNDKFGGMFLHKDTDERCKDLCQTLADIFDDTAQATAKRLEKFFENVETKKQIEGLNEFFKNTYRGEKEE